MRGEEAVAVASYLSRCLLVYLADLVALPGVPHPIPFRTRSLSPPGPMVLRLKARESRSPPGPQDRRTTSQNPSSQHLPRFAAGWSSPVARQAHNLKVVGSNPTPAPKIKTPAAQTAGVFAVWRRAVVRSALSVASG